MALSTWALEARGLTKAYGSVLALRGVDLRLPWGERLVLFGPNGAGKTTLIKVLSSLARPGGGWATVAGLEVARFATAVRRLVGVVTHQTFLYEELTGRENLLFYARMFGLPDPHRRAEEVASALGVQEHLDRRVRSLSHGLQRRFALARALLHRPPILLLDEPETGLDPEALSLLEGLLSHHCREGGAVLLTTHNLDWGLSQADRAVLLLEGRVALEGEGRTLDRESLRLAFSPAAE